MTKQDEFDFTQFKGSFDSAMSPGSDFTERMKQMLERESGAVDPQRRTTVIASPPRSNKDVPVPGRRTNPLTIAASILVVLAVVASSIWVLSDASLEGEYGSAPSGIATLPADAEVTPGPDVQMEADLLIPSEDNGYTRAVLDRVVITEHFIESANASNNSPRNYLTGWDADSGIQLWQLESYELYDFAIFGDTLLATRTIRDYSQQSASTPTSSTLLAIDSRTGKILWEQETGPGYLEIQTQKMIVVGNIAVQATSDGNLSGWNAETGEMVWESTFDPGEGYPTQIQSGPNTTPIATTMYTIAIAESDGLVAVANGDGVVHIFDPSDGTETASHQIGWSSGPGYLSLDSLPNGLLLTQGGESYLMFLIEPESGKVRWARDFDGDITVDVSENGMIAVNSHIWDSGNFIMRLLGRGGQSTHKIHWIDGATGEDVLVTERGRTDGPVFAITNGEYLCTRTEEFVCYDRVGTRHTVENGPWAQAFVEDGNLYFDRDDGVYGVELP